MVWLMPGILSMLPSWNEIKDVQQIKHETMQRPTMILPSLIKLLLSAMTAHGKPIAMPAAPRHAHLWPCNGPSRQTAK